MEKIGEYRNLRSILSIGEYKRSILSIVLYGENRKIWKI